ncbi:hypothetical protein EMIHUDRAFT_243134 [Emiliania huxleyi CCMP1516]|uniref:Uncharacterized protein n=2 Tax=Emiliania huxleyi TaxID=2903 RepID=A0A0D3J6V0_EMIH1|nr:hypothetical protein EMIHUDRAFT_243134 [Emiliania huxleyi CCMP1516]EOD19235.1 hypothetical protein EMIHUDRAFT_243134 [Emiliania huxleyi CCMP1516]|eukprot:XP_005771664.1 hypothetical protein EMIHUDRAFT_243134 [Emiliania huxleyi CCMP1516]
MREVFSGAAAFDKDLSSWNVSAVDFMYKMFYDASSLSECNKALIHASFEAQNPSGWPYSSEWDSLASFLVVASFTASGDISDFDGSMKADILETLAQLAGFDFVPLGSTLEIIAGSVNVVAKFPVATRESASSAQGNLSEAAMSTLLADGIYLETTLTIEIQDGRVQAAIIGGAYIFIKNRSPSNPSTASGSVVEMEATMDVEEANAVANIKAMQRVYSLRI